MAKPPILRNKSVTTKVTEAEYARLEEMARADGGANLSEWIRGELLGPNRNGSDTDVLLGEVLALRTIVINLLFSVAKGDRLTAEQMQALIDRADLGKTAKAQKLLSASRTAGPSAAE